MKKVRYILLGMLLLILGKIQAQINIAQSPTIQWPSSLSFAQKDEMIKALNKKLDNYKKTATLLNKKTVRIDRESVDEFKKNFSLDAKIFNDMYAFDQDYLQDLDGYIQLARLYFPTEGIRFGITKADLIAVEETDSRYSVTVRVEKQMEKYYDAEGIVHDKIRFIILDFVYDIRKGDSNSAKITTIRSGVKVDPPANYYTYSGLELNYSLANWNFKNTLSESPASGKSSGKIVNNNGKTWSAGFAWRSNFIAKPRSSSKNVFLLAGIRVSGSDWTINLNDYQLPDRFYATLENNKGAIKDSLFRTSKNIQLKESYSSLGVNASLGVSYRVFHKNNSALMVDLSYVPGFDFSKKSTISGTGDYDLVQKMVYSSDPQPTSSVDFLKKDLYLGLGQNRPIEYSTKPGKSFNHSVGLSAMYYKDLQNDLNSLGVALGLDLVWGLTPKIKDYTFSNDKFEYSNDAKADVNWDQSEGIPYRQTNLSSFYPSREDGGVLGYYLRNCILRQIGIKLIIYYKQGRKP